VVFLAGENLTAQRLNEETGWAIRKASDQGVTSSTTLVTDNTLTWPVTANTNYLFDMYLIYTGGTAGDIKIGWAVPSGSTMSWAGEGLDEDLTYKNVGALTETSVSPYGAVSTSSGRMILVAGFLSVASTAGNFAVRFAQNASSATTTTMRAGSFGILFRV
jgi:hypothetical protein